LRFLPVHSQALLVELADLEQTLALLDALQQQPVPGVVELVPAARTILVSFDAQQTTARQVVGEIAGRELTAPQERHSRLIEIAVEYCGEDLDEVAQMLGISRQEVVRRHTGSEYRVAFTGFAPGFAYLSGGARGLEVPRRSTPRTRIPAGAVALAGLFSAVYPQASPGGWQIIGLTRTPMWDLQRQPPALLQPGDRVRFVEQAALQVAVGALPATAPPACPAEAAGAAVAPVAAAFEVQATGLQTLFQDLGRPGQTGQGVAASGAMDRGALRSANRLVGNPPDAVCLESVGGGLCLRSLGDAVLAVTGAEQVLTLIDAAGRRWPLPCAQPLAVSAGDCLLLGAPSAGARAYVAVRGGWQVQAVLGSCATDTLAQIGPPALAVGDRLQLQPLSGAAIVGPPELAPRALPQAGQCVTLDVYLGPRTDWFTPQALQDLCSQEWMVTPQSNRIGIRLAGERPLARAIAGELPSEGTLCGALQVPPSGQPVLFLADHPLTGGYPVVACVAPYHRDLAGQIPVGARLRFRVVQAFAELDSATV
jgi:KipI family sensor histidine kinase inhibitor